MTTYASQATQAMRSAELNDQEMKRLRAVEVLSLRIKSNARWFYFIAGLSLVNSFLFFSNANLTFLAGLNISSIADAFSAIYNLGMVPAILFDLLAAGLFVVFGYFASQGKMWAFVVGMSLYALDSLLSLWIQDWLSLAFHGYALFSLFAGLNLCRQLTKLRKSAYPQYPNLDYPTRDTVYPSPQQR